MTTLDVRLRWSPQEVSLIAIDLTDGGTSQILVRYSSRFKREVVTYERWSLREVPLYKESDRQLSKQDSKGITFVA